jgi:hypothetical protein
MWLKPVDKVYPHRYPQDVENLSTGMGVDKVDKELRCEK